MRSTLFTAAWRAGVFIASMSLGSDSMADTRTAIIPVWRALLDGECKQIHKTEEQLWDELRNRNPWYEPENENRWTAIVSDEEVPITKGERHDWSAEGGSGGVHIHYNCPHCRMEEYCDDDPNDSSPYLWFCEHGNGIILVEVD